MGYYGVTLALNITEIVVISSQRKIGDVHFTTTRTKKYLAVILGQKFTSKTHVKGHRKRHKARNVIMALSKLMSTCPPVDEVYS